MCLNQVQNLKMTVNEAFNLPSHILIVLYQGVILSAILNESDENRGFLLVLDAKNFIELARAEFQTPSAIPTDFHGMFLNKFVA